MGRRRLLEEGVTSLNRGNAEALHLAQGRVRFGAFFISCWWRNNKHTELSDAVEGFC